MQSILKAKIDVVCHDCENRRLKEKIKIVRHPEYMSKFLKIYKQKCFHFIAPERNFTRNDQNNICNKYLRIRRFAAINVFHLNVYPKYACGS